MNFMDFARAHGIEIRELYPSERIKRCGTTLHPKSTNGAYFYDARRGWVMAWDGDGEVKWFNDPNSKPWSDEEKRAWAAQQRAKTLAQERAYQAAAGRAADMLRTARPGHHVYLDNKGLPDALGLVLPDDSLFVPMRHLQTNALQGAQIIRFTAERKWEKKMLPGMRAKGAVLRLGTQRARESILCEGWATGLSIELAIQQMRLLMSVLVCFSAGNMVLVASLLDGANFIFADNDVSRTGEESAKKTGLPYCMAPVVGWDANDWAKAEGLVPMCSAIMNVRRQLEAA